VLEDGFRIRLLERGLVIYEYSGGSGISCQSNDSGGYEWCVGKGKGGLGYLHYQERIQLAMGEVCPRCLQHQEDILHCLVTCHFCTVKAFGGAGSVTTDVRMIRWK